MRLSIGRDNVMPFTKQQLRSLANTRGQAYTTASKNTPKQLRITETYLKRTVFRLDDATIAKDARRFRDTWAEIRTYALSIAPQASKPTSYDLTQWRRRLLDALETRIQRLADLSAANGFDAMRNAYYGGLFGRLWGLDSVLKPGTPVNRNYRPFPFAYDLEWLEQYHTEADAFIVKARRLTMGVLSGQTIPQVLATLDNELGGKRGTPHGMYHRTQLITRTNVMQGFNIGGLNAYRQQIGVLREDTTPNSYITGIIWVSSRDDRVCRICEGLDGHVWLVDSLNSDKTLMDMPPMGSHPGCRCSVQVLLMPRYIVSGDTPIEQTFLEWAIANGYEAYLHPFIEFDEPQDHVTLVYQ